MLIQHIDDVLPHVEGREDFKVKRAEGYTAIDYNFVLPDTFDHPVRRECRGLKFDPAGNLLARPLHKFFNVGERPETMPDQIDFTRPHVVLEKLDGSMIHPAVLTNGGRRKLTFMTRMGMTEVAAAAMKQHLFHREVKSILAAEAENTTLIFEWVAPQNRIVVAYPQSRLVLLAARDKNTGEYLDGGLVHSWSNELNVGEPKILGSDAYGDWAGLAKHVEGLEGEEGFVVWFTDGKEPQCVKVKAPWYVTRHRALDGLRFEHHVVRLVLEGGVDDVLPLLDAADRAKLEQFRDKLNLRVLELGAEVAETVERRRHLPRKIFAELAVQNYDGILRTLSFRLLDGAHPYPELRRLMVQRTRGQPDTARLLEKLGGPRWA